MRISDWSSDVCSSDLNFTSIHLPNEAGFIEDDCAREAHYARKAEPCMTDCKPGPVKTTQRARVMDVTPASDDDGEGAASVDSLGRALAPEAGIQQLMTGSLLIVSVADPPSAPQRPASADGPP